MTKTTSTTKKSKAVAEDQNQAATEQQTSALPAPTLDPDQARKDIAAMFALAAKAALPKAAPKAARPKAARTKAS
ncbi:MAG: hypothetical protein RSC66_00060 [Comamonas sp.]